jgi:hypothetical protein
MNARTHPAFQAVAEHLRGAGYACDKEVFTKPISSTAQARIGIGTQRYRDGSLDVDVTVGVHFPALEAIATARKLPVAGSVAWTVSCHAAEFLPKGVWRFEVGGDADRLAAHILAELERAVLPRLMAFASYPSAIDELDRGFPCLWSQKRMVIPLAYVALGDLQAACRRVREFAPREPQNAAQTQYAEFAEHFHRQFCSEVE